MFNRTVTECFGACLPALHSKSRPCDSVSVGAIYFRDHDGVADIMSGECGMKGGHKMGNHFKEMA